MRNTEWLSGKLMDKVSRDMGPSLRFVVDCVTQVSVASLVKSGRWTRYRKISRPATI